MATRTTATPITTAIRAMIVRVTTTMTTLPKDADREYHDSFEWTPELFAEYAERARALAERFGGGAFTPGHVSLMLDVGRLMQELEKVVRVLKKLEEDGLNPFPVVDRRELSDAPGLRPRQMLETFRVVERHSHDLGDGAVLLHRLPLVPAVSDRGKISHLEGSSKGAARSPGHARADPGRQGRRAAHAPRPACAPSARCRDPPPSSSRRRGG